MDEMLRFIELWSKYFLCFFIGGIVVSGIIVGLLILLFYM